MSKKLAIKGHATRGKEVIELLQMMGGTNPFSKNDGMVIGNKTTNCYYISEDTATKYIFWDYIGPEEIDKYEIFTLEEFLEKYPFKVGDKVVDCYGNPVTIKSMKWSEDFETMVYDFEETEDVLCAEDIESVNDNHTKPTKMKIVLAELLEHIKATPKEELEREFEEIKEWSNVGPTIEEFRTFCECVNKKLKYPTTYGECCRVLSISDGEFMFTGLSDDEYNLFDSFVVLKRCRDAYWKIAGEEMGLDKPWEPNWIGSSPKYIITVIEDKLVKILLLTQSYILAFPTEEMRDAFYENFKDLIESCKELL